MVPLWFWIAVLIAVTLLWPITRPIVAFVFGGSIAARALANQPDAIHLEPRNESIWRDAGHWRPVADACRGLGFEPAGHFTIREMPGINLHLLAHARERFIAAIYEHPTAGAWFEFVCPHTDGTSDGFSTLRDTGLAPREGCVQLNQPGAGVDELWAKARAGRQTKASPEVSASGAARAFEEGYAVAIAWRKQKGISRSEVVRASGRRAA